MSTPSRKKVSKVTAPPKRDRRTKIVQIMFSEKEFEILFGAAVSAHYPLASWARAKLLEAAQSDAAETVGFD